MMDTSATAQDPMPQHDADGRQIFRRPPPRKDWLAQSTEPVIEPDLPIVDPHHHLWTDDGGYLLEDLLADTGSGHRIVATVFMQSHWGYHTDGPQAMQPVGEIARVASVAQDVERRRLATRVCAGIVGFADMELGDAVAPVLQAQIEAGAGRFRGIRHATLRDDRITNNPARLLPFDMLREPRFRRGLARLQAAGLSFDAWLYHTQIPQLTEVARAFPELPIILNHIGGPLGAGPYAAIRAEVFKDWRNAMRDLARCPNVHIKVGGMAMIVFGFDFHKQPLPPSSQQLADAWRPYVESCIELFGPQRCMFQSNFPVDKGSCSYRALWNAFKRITANASPDEKTALFSGTASKVYRLDLSPAA